MSSFAVVEDLHIIEQAGFGLLMCQIFFPMHLLLFERGKEALHRGIVPAVATAAHAACDALFLQALLIGMSGVLTAPVAMKEQCFCGCRCESLAHSHLQCLMHQRLFQAVFHAPADDLAAF